MRKFVFREIPARIRKSILAFLSASGITWVVVTILIAKGFITAGFSEYAFFTIGIIGIKSFKPASKVKEKMGMGGLDG